ncbi:MAG: formylglycine-generating enzyme family protein [Armatimonadetes bacterium]|nr:MAG: formylglycine-generating enzyme family protein [Armatimonadota bacterium]
MPDKVNARTIGITVAAAVVTVAAAVAISERLRAPEPVEDALRWATGPEAEPVSDDMVLIPGGEYVIGDAHHPDAPVRKVALSPCYVDRHEVTNRQFAEFVEATGYVTSAEKAGGGWCYIAGTKDWQFVKGADWRHPLGPGSSIEGAEERPVVLVSWYDAQAYAKWAGKRLPTEAEWEVAARAGKSEEEHPLCAVNGKPRVPANYWQGTWPDKNLLEDGYFYVAPVGAFPPNEWGLYGMIGNVWEWTADWYASEVPAEAQDPKGPETGTLRVAKGGSWFCSANYCGAYTPGFRGKSPPDRAFNNVGFRCAKDAEQ